MVDEVYKVPQVPPLYFTQTLTALYPKRFRCLELLPYMYTSMIKHAGFAVTVLSALVAAEAHEALILGNCVASNHANYKSSYVGYYTKAEIQVLQQSQRFPHHPGRPFGRREPRSPPYSQIMFSPSTFPKGLLQRTPMSVLVKKKLDSSPAGDGLIPTPSQ